MMVIDTQQDEKQKRIWGLVTQALFGILFLSGCGELGGIYFWVDNPTDEAIHVVIDGFPYHIKPYKRTQVGLRPGKHQITLADGDSVGFIVYHDAKEGIINPTRSPYILFDAIYIYGEIPDEYYPIEKGVRMNGVEFHGPLFLTTDVFVDRNVYEWDLGLGMPFKENAVLGKYKTFRKVRKIFTKKEFIAYYESYFEYEGYYENMSSCAESDSTTIYSTRDYLMFLNQELIGYRCFSMKLDSVGTTDNINELFIDVPYWTLADCIPVFEDAEAQKIADEIIGFMNSYLNLDSHYEQRSLQLRCNKMLPALYDALLCSEGGRISPQKGAQYDVFAALVGSVMKTGIGEKNRKIPKHAIIPFGILSKEI